MPAKKKAAANSSRVKAQIDAYISKQPVAVQKRLREMRRAIRAAAPGAVEHFSYGMPGFRIYERPLAWYGAFRQHTSLFPMTAGVRKKFQTALRGYQVSTGTVRFPLDKKLPVALVKKLVVARAAEARRETARR
jgi:uncharacterized protein YdhG (YjbR/CyaY superfamily)